MPFTKPLTCETCPGIRDSNCGATDPTEGPLIYTGCSITHGIIKTRWGGHLTTTQKAGKYLILKLKIILFKQGVSGFDAWTFL
jgi:hypothetical protein